jgi:hypothetical protein
VSRSQFILSKLRQSPVLKTCAVLAFFEYGALAIWAVFGRAPAASASDKKQLGMWFGMASWLAICSLSSWFFLFLWYPSLQLMEGKEGEGDGDGILSGLRMGRVLEIFAIGCVALVHAILAWILVSAISNA